MIVVYISAVNISPAKHNNTCKKGMRYDKYISNNTRKGWRYQKRSFRSHNSKKDRQCNGQKKKDTRANSGLQTITQKTEDRVTRTSLKSGVNSLRVRGSCSTCGTHPVVLAPHVALTLLLLLQIRLILHVYMCVIFYSTSSRDTEY